MAEVKGEQTVCNATLHEKDQWIEIGEISKDDLKWLKDLTMVLDSVK